MPTWQIDMGGFEGGSKWQRGIIACLRDVGLFLKIKYLKYNSRILSTFARHFFVKIWMLERYCGERYWAELIMR